MREEHFPDFVQDKLASLADHAQQMQVYSQAPIKQADDLRRKLAEVRRQMQAMEQPDQLPIVDIGAGRPLGPDPDRLQHLRTEAQKIEAQIEGAVGQHVRRQEAYTTVANTLNLAKHWLSHLPDNTTMSPAPAVAVPDDPDLRAVLDRTRRQLSDLQAKAAKLGSSPIAFAELQQRAEQWVQKKAASQRLAVDARRGQPFRVVIATPSPIHPVMEMKADPVALLCRLLPKAMLSAVVEAASGLPGAEAISDADFDKRANALAADIAQLERLEEAIISALVERGEFSTVVRRRDAIPSVVLNVMVGAKARRTAVAA